MLIDIERERLVTFKNVRKLRLFPQEPSMGTLDNWARVGRRGVILETCDVRCTSIEACKRFLMALAEKKRNPRKPSE